MMPQLDPTYFFSQLFWLVVSFGLFYLCIKYFILPKLEHIVYTRTSIRKDSEALAQKLASEIAQMKQETKRKSEEIEILVKRLKNDSDLKFDSYSKDLLSKMNKSVDTEFGKANKEIEEFKKQFISSNDMSDLTIESAKKIIFKFTSIEVSDKEMQNLIK